MSYTPRYIAASDIDDVFGADNVTAWSDIADAGTRDSARVLLAIRYAEAEVESRFRGGPYAIPFITISEGGLVPLVDVMACLAGWWLYRSRGMRGREEYTAKIKAVADEAMAKVNEILEGTRELDLERQRVTPNAPSVVGYDHGHS